VAVTYLLFSRAPISDYLADSVDAFLTASAEEDSDRSNAIDVDSSAIPLGLTFSFPVEQTAIDRGILLTWTKGFSAKNAINKDVVRLLQDAFDRKHLHVECVALVNDV
jgi:hexokinase